mmetsp:Transcript_50959/g.164978  ORF Transcript_50959/g.164978 Transcript_50959/m.164978 type:complete len:209 (-) Transcript_50959:112-738(-)|eukprot:CAMPEP_0203873458 /NCGR_PEP_ID=MMETSP0359-20131031/19758_1 /ASSEMBLY_ACC=CAM_ASM_000338 /TAXON_ID=268821 /ORGANISM="Scrippsiella Hangoei, Strain SHTV-5" /LENGTH=208 /DNA_ID=CAMNT_0050792155 /DNA_START=183 /DNA_END=809 /DNA_ORIENTATION=-
MENLLGVPPLDVKTKLEYKPSKGLHGEFYQSPVSIHESSYQSDTAGAAERHASAVPKLRYPMPPSCGDLSARSSRPGGAKGLADAGRAALGMSPSRVAASPRIEEGELAAAVVAPKEKISPACSGAWGGSSVASLLSCAPPSQSALSSPRLHASYTSYGRCFETSGGAATREFELSGHVDKTHHMKKNEMIEVARMQARTKLLMRSNH